MVEALNQSIQSTLACIIDANATNQLVGVLMLTISLARIFTVLLIKHYYNRLYLAC